MTRALFFLGCGEKAELIGSIDTTGTHTPAPAEPVPDTLAVLPVGQAVLAATDPEHYRAAVPRLLAGWQTVGFGRGDRPENSERLVGDVCPASDGHYDEARLHRCFAYAFAFVDDHVRWWRAGAWHTLTIPDPTGTHAVGIGGRRVEVVPTARRYGEQYCQTKTLDLPQLAVWITAELVTRAEDPDYGLAPEHRYAALVNPTRRDIRFLVFGVRNDELHEFPGAPAEGVIRFHTAPIIAAHNWTNPTDRTDYRFSWRVEVSDEFLQGRERDCGRGPGTVTVIDADRPDWWW